ncbi:MAG: PAS domain S-box protein, partial [Chloroflexi bacterium]|nr:PAS domain S-box protein [Chloroflexota bacterium]
DAAYGLASPVTPEALEVPLDETLSGTVVRTGQTLIEAHVWGRSAHANKTLQRLGVKTLVVVPMTVEQRVVGALTLAHPDVVELDEVTLRIAASLANYVASLTERRRAERDLQRAHDHLDQRVSERTGELARANEELRQEIADRQRMQAALAQSEAKWRSLVESVPSAIMTVERDGTILFASRPLSHRDGRDVTGQNVFGLIRPDQRSALREALERVFDRGERHTVEVSSGGSGDLRWFSVRLGPIREEQQIAGAVLVTSDITERRLLEDQLRQSSKMEAIGQLAGGVAHDFNNLLTVINGYSQFMVRRLPEDDPLRHDLEEIRRAGERAAKLTRQLLALSRRQDLELEIIDVNEVIDGMCSMLSRVLGEDIILDLNLAEDLGATKADAAQVEQVLLNLAVNARDAMPTGGALIIETANITLDEEFSAGHLGLRPGQYVRVVVSDTGCGMAPQVLAHLFEPFHTTKDPGKGTGLGLATVYGIVKQFGGEIYVYSEANHGTVFKIYLPRADAPPVVARPSCEATAQLPGGSETVMVVEDKPDARLFTVTVLERLGYTVLEAAGSSDALALFSARQEPVDLVMTDVVMPGMNGMDLVGRLGRVCAGFRTLYTSGYTDHAILRQGVLAPGTSFIEKPFSVEGLARKVRTVLDTACALD